MPFDPKDARSFVVALGLGAAAGAAIIQSHHDQEAKSRAEKDDSSGCEWLCDLIWDLLTDWESEPCETEDDYTDDLVEYLREELRDVRSPDDDRRIKVEKRVCTDFGVPDIIIDDRLVLELKLGPHEGEKDRLIGQCCKYSVEWVTWAVVLGMSRKKAKKLVTLLKKKSLHYIDFRLTQERSDFLLPQIRDFVSQKKWINLRPEYQRRTVWDDAKRSLFIESLLLNVPIPPIFLYERDLSRYEVMDGQQRLNAIVDFYENWFALKGLERWSLINGWRYSELPETLKRGLDQRRISATVLLVGGGEDGAQQPEKSAVRKLVFDRLTTGGQPLNRQELRNCLFAGDFNDLVTNKLSADPIFTAAWGIPAHADNVDKAGKPSEELRKNPLYRRMLDCELVLRFLRLQKDRQYQRLGAGDAGPDPGGQPEHNRTGARADGGRLQGAHQTRKRRVRREDVLLSEYAA